MFVVFDIDDDDDGEDAVEGGDDRPPTPPPPPLLVLFVDVAGAWVVVEGKGVMGSPLHDASREA